jgi:hypothetical protein
MAAGFMAGITEALLIVTPFEVVKIRLQQQKGCAKSGLKYKVGAGFWVLCGLWRVCCVACGTVWMGQMT